MSTPNRRSPSKRKIFGASAALKSPVTHAPPPSSSPPATSNNNNNKVFSKEDEIRLLRALLESTVDPNVTLPIGNFSQTQIAAKIKRMKERYHLLAKSKSRIKTAHDEEVYQIARLIWGKQAKKPPPKMVKISPETVEQTKGEVDLGGFPNLVENLAVNFPGNDVFLMGLRRLGSMKLEEMNEQWKVIMDEEAELMVKKAQFCKEIEQLITA